MAKPTDQYSYVQWKNLKNIENQTVNSFKLIVRKMRSEVTNLINVVGEQTVNIPLKQSNLVALRILFRINELMVSIDHLISIGTARDAAVLLLHLMEQRLKLQLIAKNPAFADNWITTNSDKNRDTWTIMSLIQKLFPMKKNRKSELHIYGNLLSIKQSDPMEKHTSFPVSHDETHEADNNDLSVCLFQEGSECYQALIAAAKDFSDSGFDIKTNETVIKELNELKEKLHSLNNAKKSTAPKYY
ncbi:MAG: hypothetical protein GY864_15550 [Desulfobacterales bacterium]|nr:hypothetical protein [Desulfobacterales bacterium]